MAGSIDTTAIDEGVHLLLFSVVEACHATLVVNVVVADALGVCRCLAGGWFSSATAEGTPLPMPPAADTASIAPQGMQLHRLAWLAAFPSSTPTPRPNAHHLLSRRRRQPRLVTDQPQRKQTDCVRERPLNCSSNHVWKVQNVKLPDPEKATARGEMSMDECKRLIIIIKEEEACVGDNHSIDIGISATLLSSCNGEEGKQNSKTREPSRYGSPQVWRKVMALNWTSDDDVSESMPIMYDSDTVALHVFTRLLRGLWWDLHFSTFSSLKKISGLKIYTSQWCHAIFVLASITTLGVLASYDLFTIKAATNDFSDENKPGEGGIGVVYNVGFQVSTNKLLILPNLQISNVRLCQGELQDGQKIAVKKLSRYSLQGSNE
ncbi:hypothetical protein ZIOFF_011156 [Zingiber officinale]|uniref:Uncharacterized protein n=1 Tax=Zingiber officinale TaxID=94328 RepID=A0A8J5M0H9_ZINOF|nr:hypothetical protein ZIOFF_011156 [Zingiber officinale]